MNKRRIASDEREIHVLLDAHGLAVGAGRVAKNGIHLLDVARHLQRHTRIPNAARRDAKRVVKVRIGRSARPAAPAHSDRQEHIAARSGQRTGGILGEIRQDDVCARRGGWR